ncbi:hypothetical protein SEUCBS139899_001522 [Sporothrix eucalyptigena]|uniref:Uncharacterized protein n=1 Tax=Sporothrix eucalyptigena TaxID=1812306 RepID=A0ABP0BKF9_9PEZI
MPPAAVACMASLRQAMPAAWKRYACVQCRRTLSTSPAVASGHNRWSKIRHEKGAADLKKTALRTGFTKSLTLYSQMYGADPALNPQLASVVQNAKKAGVPKAVIEAAIARGQGKSADGAKLDNVTYEIMMPPSVAIIVDLETESKARALQDLNAIIRRKGGTLTPTKFFFMHRGRVVLGPAEDSSEEVSVDDILEDAIEAGAEDVEADEDGNIIVWTPPMQTGSVVSAIEGGPFKSKLSVVSAETIWAVNEETRSPLGDGNHGQSAVEQRKLQELVAAFRAYADVKAVYSNVAQGEATDEFWHQLEQDLDW